MTVFPKIPAGLGGLIAVVALSLGAPPPVSGDSVSGEAGTPFRRSPDFDFSAEYAPLLALSGYLFESLV